jgi:hypothetical protein
MYAPVIIKQMKSEDFVVITSHATLKDRFQERPTMGFAPSFVSRLASLLGSLAKPP